MSLGNVLVIGNSGVGKSTLINAVMGEDIAPIGNGKRGTKELRIYENEQAPFRIIDTVGFEPSAKEERKAISAVRRWCRDGAKKGNDNTQINVIWFCVDGIGKRLFAETIKSMTSATSMFKSVPIVVVVTKSFSDDDQDNIVMVRDAFESQSKGFLGRVRGVAPVSDRLKGIVPVVAQAYRISEDVTVAPKGITELIELTNELMPEGVQAAKNDLNAFVLNRKRAMAQGFIVPTVAAAVVAGLAPAPVDVPALSVIEAMQLKALAKIYEIPADDDYAQFAETALAAGATDMLFKTLLNVLKAVPGVNIAGEILNAIVAGGIVATFGEVCAVAFEKVYKGEKDIKELDWFKQFFDEEFTNALSEKIKTFPENWDGKMDAKSIAQAVVAAFAVAKNPDEKEAANA